MSRMSEFNSKFGGGARQLRCQGFDTFLHTLILCTVCTVGSALGNADCGESGARLRILLP